MAGEFGNPEVVEEEVDILLIGGGMACCGAAYEVMRWIEAAKKDGHDLSVKMVDKAALDRSGAVAQGLSAINTYIGDEQDPADYARMVSNDLMGITRDDLAYDCGRHVDESVHLFEEWGLPIWKTDENGERHDGSKGLTSLADGGKPVRSGKWQIMINGESYKWIVAEAAKKALGEENIIERCFIVELLLDANKENQIAGASPANTRAARAQAATPSAIEPRSAKTLPRAALTAWNAGMVMTSVSSNASGNFDNHWHVSTYMADQIAGKGPGNHAMWCGTVFDGDPGYGNGWYQSLVFTHVVADPPADQAVRLEAMDKTFEVEALSLGDQPGGIKPDQTDGSVLGQEFL